MKKLLICTDGSNYSQECCHYGAWFAKKTGVYIDVLYVTDLRQFEIPAVADLSGSLGIQPYEGMISQLRELEEKKSKFVEESAMKIFKSEGLAERTKFYHETGLLVDSIEEYADRADLTFDTMGVNEGPRSKEVDLDGVPGVSDDVVGER